MHARKARSFTRSLAAAFVGDARALAAASPPSAESILARARRGRRAFSTLAGPRAAARDRSPARARRRPRGSRRARSRTRPGTSRSPSRRSAPAVRAPGSRSSSRDDERRAPLAPRHRSTASIARTTAARCASIDYKRSKSTVSDARELARRDRAAGPALRVRGSRASSGYRRRASYVPTQARDVATEAKPSVARQSAHG